MAHRCAAQAALGHFNMCARPCGLHVIWKGLQRRCQAAQVFTWAGAERLTCSLASAAPAKTTPFIALLDPSAFSSYAGPGAAGSVPLSHIMLANRSCYSCSMPTVQRMQAHDCAYDEHWELDDMRKSLPFPGQICAAS